MELIMRSMVFFLFCLAFDGLNATPMTEPKLIQEIALPWDDDDADVEFVLITRNSLDDPVISKIKDEGKLFNGTFDVNKDTKILIHGWLDNWKKEFAQSTAEAYLSRYDCNVIAVSWSEAETIIYPWSRYKVDAVGQITAKFLERLSDEYGFNVSSAHLVGHSLGAHIAAVAGKNVITNKIGKISGLDPALPLFIQSGADTLNANSAIFVEVVHTSGDAAGFLKPLGDVDFYPNGGLPLQPGCLLDLQCNHLRAFRLFAEAITNSTSFMATQCSDWTAYKKGDCKENEKIYWDENTDQNARGSYFMRTAGSSPYGLGVLG